MHQELQDCLVFQDVQNLPDFFMRPSFFFWVFLLFFLGGVGREGGGG